MLTAVSIAFLHTIMGPDHYLPFIAMARIRRWSHAKTALITILCGLGHVLSSIVLGFVGIGLGVAVARLEGVESARGGLAGWALIAFGMVYCAWGLRRAFKGAAHAHGHAVPHPHNHGNGILHTHAVGEPVVAPAQPQGGARELTPWVLFTIFVFGPCEPLIPMLMYPAAVKSLWGVALVAGVFAVTTIATMLIVVLAATLGLARLPTAPLERYSHALAGLIILLCGASIQFLGL